MMLQRIGLLLCVSAVLNTVEGIEAWHIMCIYALMWAWGLLTEQTVVDYINNKGRQ
jgi:hypothetical protein